MKYSGNMLLQYVNECVQAHFFYVDHHMSYDQVARELLTSKMTVKRRLEGLKDIDKDLYDEYIAEKRCRKNGKK